MSDAVELSPMRAGMTALLAFGFLLWAMHCVYANPYRYHLIVAGVIVPAVLYFAVSAIKGGILYDILGGFMVGAIISVIVEVIPFLDVILTVAFLIAGFVTLFETIKKMLPEIILSFGMFASLSHIHMIRMGYRTPAPHELICLALAFAALALITCVRVGRRASSGREALLLLSLTFLSIPLVVILLVSLVASIRSSSRTALGTRKINVNQKVSAHMRSPAFSTSGMKSIYVRDYSRTLTKTVTVAVTAPGPSIMGMGMTAALSRKLTGKK